RAARDAADRPQGVLDVPRPAHQDDAPAAAAVARLEDERQGDAAQGAPRLRETDPRGPRRVDTRGREAQGETMLVRQKTHGPRSRTQEQPPVPLDPQTQTRKRSVLQI